MRPIMLSFGAVGTGGMPVGLFLHPAIKAAELVSICCTMPRPCMTPFYHRFFFLGRGTSQQWPRRLSPQGVGLSWCRGAESSSCETAYRAATLPVRKLHNSLDMRRSCSRFLSTTAKTSFRIWLARLPERPALWRSLVGWGDWEAKGQLLEVLVPSQSGTVSSWAVGGFDVLAVSEGRLFGAPLSVPRTERSVFPSPLSEIEPAPVEASGVSVSDFIRHCKRSEDLEIPPALAARPTTNAETDMHPRFVKVAAGKQHFAALTSHGILYTWGNGGSWGAGSPLGHGDSKNRCRPTLVDQFVKAGEFVVDVACGTASTCVVTRSGRVFSSGAADFGVNGSGMLVSSKVFKELEFFQGILSPVLLEAKRRVVEEHLQHLEKLRKSIEEKGTKKFHTFARPFETYQDTPEEMHYKSAPAGSPCLSVRAGVRFPKVMCGTYHCGLLTPDGALWVWGRNDCLQLGREKSVMASGGESNYPLLVEFFSRADLPLESCALGSSHSLALSRNGAVFEWGGPNAELPHAVDMHWQYPGSIFKSRAWKVAAGGFSRSTGFSAVLTEEGEAFLWGPGALKMPLGLKATEGRTPELLCLPLHTKESLGQQDSSKWRVVDIVAGQQGCLLVTTDSA